MLVVTGFCWPVLVIWWFFGELDFATNSIALTRCVRLVVVKLGEKSDRKNVASGVVFPLMPHGKMTDIRPVVQRIGPRSSKAIMGVRFPPGRPIQQ